MPASPAAFHTARWFRRECVHDRPVPPAQRGAPAAGALGVGLGLNLRDVAAAAGAPIPALPMPYGGSLLDNALAVLLALLLAALLRPMG